MHNPCLLHFVLITSRWNLHHIFDTLFQYNFLFKIPHRNGKFYDIEYIYFNKVTPVAVEALYKIVKAFSNKVFETQISQSYGTCFKNVLLEKQNYAEKKSR